MEDPITSTVNSVFIEELMNKNKEFYIHIRNTFACQQGGNGYLCCDLPNETKEYFLNNYPYILTTFNNLKDAMDSVRKPASNIHNGYRCNGYTCSSSYSCGGDYYANVKMNEEMNKRLVDKFSTELEAVVLKTFDNFNKSIIKDYISNNY